MDYLAIKLNSRIGQAHYQLLEQFSELGGIEGAIHRIQEKLIANPNDVEGWLLLGKLYLSKQDTKRAEAALQKAHTLSPDNIEINRLLHQS
jgi:cytochrome c-type biogenesis protein CcmH/NrfG